MAAPADEPALRAWHFPVVVVALCAVAGDGLALRAGAGVPTLLAALAGLSCVVLAPPGWVRWIGLAALAFAVAHGRADLAYRPWVAAGDIAALSLPGTYEVAGRVARPPELRDGGLRLVVAVESVRGRGRSGPAHGSLALQMREVEHAWAEGDRLRGWMRLRRPRNFGNPGEFDYERSMARRGLRVSAFLYRDAGLERRPAATTDRRGAWRAGVAATIERRLGGAEARLLSALVLGMGASVPAEVRESFARAGVSHILAVSGLHIGFVAGVGFAGFRWLLSRSERLLLWTVVPRVAAALSLLPVLAYAGIAGSNVATGRAVLMAALVFGSVLVDRQRNLPVALGLAAIVAIAATPGVTADVSFQLSFAAVAALLVALERFQRWWPVWEEEKLLRLRPRRAWAWRIVATYGVVSVAALLATTPLVAYHFNRVSLAAPLANLIITPLLGSLVVPTGLLAALVYPLSETVAGWLVTATKPLLWLSIELAAWIAARPGASFRVPTPRLVVLVALYAACLLAAAGGRRWRRAALAAALAGLAVQGGIHLAGRLGPDALRVTFLSVGQGDSAVVEFPSGEVMVVDGGGMGSRTFDVGERIVAPYLWSRGLRRVDVVVVSHPDWDHFGGLGFIAETFRPHEVWIGDDGVATPAWRRFVDRVEGSGARWVEVRRGATRRFGEASIEVLWPPVATGGMKSNDRSIVLAIEYAGQRLLLPGDVEARSETALVAADPAALASRILKAPHHGSATSSTAPFIAATAPTAVVVSAGSYNHFGFPDRAVVRRYRGAGARILRTDLDGAVTATISADGDMHVTASRSARRDDGDARGGVSL